MFIELGDGQSSNCLVCIFKFFDDVFMYREAYFSEISKSHFLFSPLLLLLVVMRSYAMLLTILSTFAALTLLKRDS